MNIDTLHKLYAGGRVERLHTCPTISRHTVAEHCFGVVNMLLWITDGECSRDLLIYAMAHDIEEQYTGDVPAPAKWENPALAEALKVSALKFLGSVKVVHKLIPKLTSEEQSLFKWADILDLAMFSLHELNMGNAYAADILQACLWWGEDSNRSPELADKAQWGRVKEVMEYLRTEFTRMAMPPRRMR